MFPQVPTGSQPPFQEVPPAAVAMMLKHSVVVVGPALEYQAVAVGVTLVSDVIVFVDDVSAVAAAAEAAAGAATAVVASQPVNNHYYTLVLVVN